MGGINKVILVGNLGKDPEVRFVPNGDAVANLTLATSDTWKDRQTGEQKERTEWHKVIIWGKLAEVAGEYLKKGNKVYIEGQLQTRKWQNQQGQDQYTTEIIVQGFNGKMEMLGGPSGNSNNGNHHQQNQGGFQKQAQPQKVYLHDGNLPSPQNHNMQPSAHSGGKPIYQIAKAHKTGLIKTGAEIQQEKQKMEYEGYYVLMP